MSLKQKALTGIKWTTLSAVVVTILQLLQLSILAKILDPNAFGLMAIAMVIIGFSQAFLDMGISNAIIHKQQIDHEQLSTLYWVNVLAGAVLFLIIATTAPFIADFYEEAELTNIIIIVSLTFLIQPFGQQFMVLFQKEMQFEAIAKIDIANKFISLIVSVLYAYQGAGVYALVYGVLSGVVIQTFLFVIIGLKVHRPSLIFRPGCVLEFLHFGAYQMGEKTVNYFNSQIDVILIGKLMGTEALGIYSVAKQLIVKPALLLNPIVTKVTFPLMAKLQNDIEPLKNIYLRTVNLLTSANFFFYLLMIILAPELVQVLFGVQWLEAIPIVQILSVYGAVKSSGNPVGYLLLAKGKANWGLYWNLALLFYTPVGIIVASHWGILGIAIGLTLMVLSLILPNWYFLVRPLCGARFAEYHAQILKPLFVALIVGLFSYLPILYIDNIVLKFIAVISVATALFIAASFLFNHSVITALSELKRKSGRT